MALKTSLVIEGDASGATKAVGEATRAVEQLGAAGKGAAGGLDAESRAQSETATSARTLAAAQGQAAGATRDAGQAAAAGAIEQRRLAGAGAEAERSAAAATLASTRLGEAQRRLRQEAAAAGRPLRDNTDEMARSAAGARNLGQQVGDLGLSIAGGVDPARAFGQQIGQIGYALSEMSGAAGAVGAFLTGPWGIALTIASAVLAPFVQKLFETEDAISAVEFAGDRLSASQANLGTVMDLQTGKINTQRLAFVALAIEKERVAGIEAKSRGRTAANAVFDLGDAQPFAGKSRLRGGAATSLITSGLFSLGGAIFGDDEQNPELQAVARRAIDRAKARERGVPDNQLENPQKILGALQKLQREGKITTKLRNEAGAAIANLGAEVENRLTSDAALRQLQGTGTAADRALLLKPKKAEKPEKPKKPKDLTSRREALEEFGEDTGDKIAAIVGQFDTTPGIINKISAKVRQLDDIIDDLGRKRPNGFAALIASAEAAKETVRNGIVRELGAAFEKPKTLADRATAAFGQLDAVAADLEKRKPPGFETTIAQLGETRRAITQGLNEPLGEFLVQQREQYAQGRLILDGREAEGAAMRAIVAIERQRGPLAAAQRAEIEASVAALGQQERQLERVRAKQQVNLDALADQRDIIRQTISEGPKSLAALPGRILDSFKNYSVDKLTEDLFGELFRDLRDQATGANKVDDATQTLVDAFTEAATAARGFSGAVAGAGGSGAIAGAVPGAIGGAGAGAVAMAGGLVSAIAGSGGGTASGGVADAFGAAASLARSRARIENPEGKADIVVTGRRRFEPFEKAIGGTVEKIAGFFTSPESAEKLGKSIGKSSGAALGGALQGQAAASYAGLAGVRTSQAGASIGGAIGGVLGSFKSISAALGPFGQLLGPGIGLLGGVLGGLFKKTPTGSVVIDGATGKATTSGKLGGELGGGASAVQQAVQQIADRLGGTLGGFNVAIGKRGDEFRVSASGSAGNTTAKRTGGDIVYKGKDEAAANAAAIRNAIADGAVQGLSGAVRQALGSSADLDRALKEALGVQEVELLMGGVLAQYRKAFREFEATAKERVRIAGQYGFDVVAIEKRNADDRLKLAAELGRAQAGSLQALVDELTRGNLFEGSAVDRIGALNDAIAKAKADLDANVDGAGDRLASLSEQKLGVSREAYGTTGAYAADRDAVLGDAQAAVARVNARIAAARGDKPTSDPALATTNQALDENNDQNARILSTLDQIKAQLAAAPAFVSSGNARLDTLRMTNLR